MLLFQEESIKCDGCGRCQVACSFGATMPLRTRDPGIPIFRAPLLWIDEIEGKRRISICRHCEIPVCVDACVSGALWIDYASGTVRVRPERCIGCYSCVMECPFGAIQIIPTSKETADSGLVRKCDGCINYPAPLCVVFCPTGALQTAKGASQGAAKQRRQRAALVTQTAGSTSPICRIVKAHG